MKNICRIILSFLIILLLSGCNLFGEDLQSVTIDYNCNGIDEYKCVTDNNKLNCIIIVPECKGYSFVGWYDAKTSGNTVNLDSDFKNNSKIYAVWEEDGSAKSSATKTTTETTTVVTPVIKKYTVTFDKNGASGSVPKKVNVKYDEMMPEIGNNTLTRNGYSFMGWYSNKEYTLGKEYYNEYNEPVKYYDVKKNITLYAGWKKEKTVIETEPEPTPTPTTPVVKTYTVTFNINGGTGNVPAKFEVENGAKMPSITSKIPTKSGYTFTGWYDNKDYTKGSAYYDEKNEVAKYFDKKSNMTLYAGWSKDIVVLSYKIIFNPNGGSGGQTDAVMIKTGESLPRITSTAPTKTGYTFLGWYDSVNNGTQYYSSTGSALVKFTKSENVTLYAHWKANTYKISFNANGGSGSVPSVVTATYGSKVPSINSNKPTRSGYTFMGWYDNTNYSSGKSYYTAKNESVLTYNVAKDLVLYAGWSKNSDPSYTVTFNSNGGSGGQTSSVTVKKGSAMPTINTTAPARTGYTFAGWYDSLSGGSMYYSKEGKSAKSYDKTSGCTLYARWTAITYKISYSLNGGTSGSNVPTSSTYDKVITINNPSKTFTVTIDSNSSGAALSSTSASAKQTFLGWTADSNLDVVNARYGSTTSTNNSWLIPSDKVTSIYFKNLMSKSGTVNLTANWKSANITLPKVTKNGYICGYSTTATGTIKYNSGAAYTSSITAGSTKLYVICNAAKYTLVYDANGGSVSPKSKEIEYGATYGTLPTPTRSDYTFNGWFTAKEGGSQVSATTKMGTKNTTIYAQWTAVPKTYTVTYNANGGSGTMSPSTATYNANFVTRKNAFTRSGYTFNGWNEKSDGTGTAWTLTSTGVYENGNGVNPWKWTYQKNITLYAQWKAVPKTYTVTYNANGGTGTMSNSTVTYNTNFVTRKNTFTRSGYTFNGWNEKADGSGTAWTLTGNGVYENGNGTKPWKWTYQKDITLYAQWKRNGVALNVASYNIGYFDCGRSVNNCLTNEKDTHAKINHLINTINSEQIDLLGLQEVRNPDKSGCTYDGKYCYFDRVRCTYSTTFLQSILKGLGLETSNATELHKHFTHSCPNNVDATYSKYEIDATKTVNKYLRDGRSIDKVVIKVGGVNISFYNTHLGLNDDNEKDWKTMADWVNEDENPVIITGDYNCRKIDRYNTYLKDKGFIIAAHDDINHNMNKAPHYMDSVFVRPYGKDKVNHISVTGSKTLDLYDKYSDHNMVIAYLSVY